MPGEPAPRRVRTGERRSGSPPLLARGAATTGAAVASQSDARGGSRSTRALPPPRTGPSGRGPPPGDRDSNGRSGRISVSAELSTGSPQRSAPAATASWPSRASARLPEPLEVRAEVALLAVPFGGKRPRLDPGWRTSRAWPPSPRACARPRPASTSAVMWIVESRWIHVTSDAMSAPPEVHVMAQSAGSGLEGVVVADTTLSEVDGERGRLVIAGHDVERLAGASLLRGALPGALGGRTGRHLALRAARGARTGAARGPSGSSRASDARSMPRTGWTRSGARWASFRRRGVRLGPRRPADGGVRGVHRGLVETPRGARAAPARPGGRPCRGSRCGCCGARPPHPGPRRSRPTWSPSATTG